MIEDDQQGPDQRTSDEERPDPQPTTATERWRETWWGDLITTFASPVIATLALLATIDNSLTNKESLFVNDRAWIQVNLQIGLVGNKLSYVIRYINPGKSPALRVSLTVQPRHWMLSAANVTQLDSESLKNPENNTCVLDKAPNIHYNENAIVWPNSDKVQAVSDAIPLRTGEGQYMQAMLVGKATFSVQGCMKYMTEGRLRYVAFCQFPLPEVGVPANQWHWSDCGAGNAFN